MRIAAISDIHGNLTALDAVLADIARRGVDIIVNLGDILSGPLLPRETAERLMALDLATIRGNHERQVMDMALKEMGASDRYAAETITSPQLDWLAALPATLSISKEVFLCHATPRSDIDCYLEDIIEGVLIPAPLARIKERTSGCEAELILCGHTHIPRVVTLENGQMIVNPGSVGIQAYDGHHPVPHRVEMGSPHARYGIAERRSGIWYFEMIAIPYDWVAAARLAQLHHRPDWERALRLGFM